MMKRWLVQLGLWIARCGGWQPTIPPLVRELAERGVSEQDRHWPDRDGEAKRSAVYRSLINAFPGESKRLLSRAIEEAVCSGS